MAIDKAERLTTYEAKSEKPLMFLALLFVFSAIFQVFLEAQSWLNQFLEFANWIVWAIYVVDYAYRLYLTDKKLHWVARHPLELAMVFLPLLRPLRLLRVIPVLVMLFRSGKVSLAGRSLTFVAAGLFLVTIPAAIALYQIESEQMDSPIKSGGDAIWWAVTTVTTVGYGDMYPVTTAGRVISVFVIILGITFIGVLTAAVASWFVEQADNDLADKKDVADLIERLEQIEKQISDIRNQERSGS